MKPRALITGITGQDGSYLSELLLEKNYIVYGLVRRTTNINYNNIKHLLNNNDLILLTGDVTDDCIHRYISEYRFDEIYNLAAQSFVGASFDCAKSTLEINSLGLLNILEGVRSCRLEKHTKIYQASTSELFGINNENFCTEDTPFYPRSPYGVSKLAAHWLAKNYRESYDMFISSGILFNHESPRRGIEFVTQKIATAFKNKEKVSLGNINAKRDWGHAKDYVRGMHLMLQQEKPDDYVLATGVTKSIREFVEAAARLTYKGEIKWSGEGLNERGYIDDECVVDINPKFYRPAEVEYLLGDSSKAEKELNWKRNYSFEDLVEDMTTCY